MTFDAADVHGWIVDALESNATGARGRPKNTPMMNAIEKRRPTR